MDEQNEKKPQDGEIEESLAAKRLAHFEPDIREGDGAEAVIPREPGLRGFLKHAWFHHKFGILTTVFLSLIAIICLHQCSTRNTYDLDLMYAGPWLACDTQTAVSGVNEAFLSLAGDYDGNGQKNIAYSHLLLLSPAQLEALQAENAGKEPDEQIYVSSSLLKNNRELLDAGVMTGEMSLCLLDPSIYQYFRENGLLEPLSGFIPEGSIPENKFDNYGFFLKDTEFGAFFGGVKDMPADTIVCVRRAGDWVKDLDPASYEKLSARYTDILTKMVTFEAP